MADPRVVAPQARRTNHSPLMQALTGRGSDPGAVVNFCPFGCPDADLDEHGHCAHLVGFTSGGNTYEPRVRQGTGRVAVLGNPRDRKPLQKGDRLVRITTSARVYRPEPVKGLSSPRPALDRETEKALAAEADLRRLAEELKNPPLDGEWDGPTAYGVPVGPPAAK